MLCKILCPGCRVKLGIPFEAGGRVARCRECGIRFRLPDFKDRLEETAVGWLCESVLEHDEADDHETHPLPHHTTPEQAAEHARHVERQLEKVPLNPVAPAAIFKEPKLRDEMPDAAAKSSDGGEAGQPGVGPFNLDALSTTPSGRKLRLLGITPVGVKFSFTAGWLNHNSFRASMPLVCVGCGQADVDLLIAVPIAWVDRAFGHRFNPHEIEQEHRLHMRGRGNAEAALSAMAPIDALLPPFNRPMPYFCCDACITQLHVQGQILASSEGIECEVVVPSGSYAMAWLAAMNGANSPDCAELEAKILHMESGPWRSIPQRVRERLAGWFHFVEGEEFQGYLADSDYTAHDIGYGGLIVTTRRLVYQKFSCHGAIDLDRPGRLFLLGDGVFELLSCETHGGERKDMVRLRRSDSDQMIELLSAHPHRIELFRQ